MATRDDPPVPGRDDPAAAHALLDQQRETSRQLQAAVESRDLVGQAKGILMERHSITAEAAFALLQGQSSRRNSRLVDVAEQLIDPGPAERAETRPQRTRL
ncbi:ANTAR domain-containing protein [Arthrobacter echini]|uniref:ANTAR domain-containing protein n=2 Tax=Arthrobacter echini TaxID=1529066 RepID=A0A5D0XV82_9MICC|nr:ANTAR domain-containing protein [Arthrobacter echini]